MLFIGAGVLALGAYGFVATFQPDPHFGRILAAYGGVFAAGSCYGASSSAASVPTATTSPERSSAYSASPIIMYTPHT